MCIVAINVEEPTTYQGTLGEINRHQTTRGESKVNIGLCISKIYHRTYFEEILSIFYQVGTVVLYLDFHIPDKPPTPKSIGKVLKGPQRQYQKEYLSVKYY